MRRGAIPLYGKSMLKSFIMEQVFHLHKADGQENSPAILCARRNMAGLLLLLFSTADSGCCDSFAAGDQRLQKQVSAIGGSKLSEADILKIQLAFFNQKKVPKIHGKINRGIG